MKQCIEQIILPYVYTHLKIGIVCLQLALKMEIQLLQNCGFRLRNEISVLHVSDISCHFFII